MARLRWWEGKGGVYRFCSNLDPQGGGDLAVSWAAKVPSAEPEPGDRLDD
jgi:hypothetical protein